MTRAQHVVLLAGLSLAIVVATGRRAPSSPEAPWRCQAPQVVRWRGRLHLGCWPPGAERRALAELGACRGRQLAGLATFTRGASMLEVVEQQGRCWTERRRLGGALRLALGLRLDPNRATAEDLAALPRIGPVLSRRIVAHRAARGPFARVEELRQVRGIGPATLGRIRRYLRVGGAPAERPK